VKSATIEFAGQTASVARQKSDSLKSGRWLAAALEPV
jgi:hypothetical protein